MKFDINQIPTEGLTLAEEIAPEDLDIETDLIKCLGSVKVKADVSKITNTVAVHLNLNATMKADCSRCLNEFNFNLKKDMKLDYLLDKPKLVIDLKPDIREEIILDYPLKPLCKPDCKGLCPKCGKNLNEGGCPCGST